MAHSPSNLDSLVSSWPEREQTIKIILCPSYVHTSKFTSGYQSPILSWPLLSTFFLMFLYLPFTLLMASYKSICTPLFLQQMSSHWLVYSNLISILFHLLVDVLPAYMFVGCLHIWCLNSSEKGIRSLEFQVVGNHHVDAGNEILDLWKSSCSS